MSQCFICNGPLGEDDVYNVKMKGVQTLQRASVERNKQDHIRFLENATNISVHLKCYKRYTDMRHRNIVVEDAEMCTEGNEELHPEPEPDFNVRRQCFFCCTDIPEDLDRYSREARKNILTVTRSDTTVNIKKCLLERGDEVSLSILQRVQNIPDLSVEGARYHRNCLNHFMHYKTPTGNRKGRPGGGVIDEAMNDIYSFLENNSEECQFSLDELMAQVQRDTCPNKKTVKSHLLQKYGDDIIILNTKRGTMVCFKNTGYKLLSDTWYAQRESNSKDERLRVVREAAAIIREDIRSTVYDLKNYPPSDNFLQSAESEVPESLNVFLSELINKGKRVKTVRSVQSMTTKCISIAHSLISAVRPRSFYSSIKLGVAAFLYKKFSSKTLIDILSNLGFSASYSEVMAYQNSCIHKGSSEIQEGAFSQFVFDNADFNVKTIDGHGTFHAMGGIHCVTPRSGVAPDIAINRIMKRKNDVEVALLGSITVLPYSNHALAGLQTITVADINELHPLTTPILPTIPDFIWLYSKWSCTDDSPGWNGFMEEVTKQFPFEVSRILCLPFINAPPSDYDTILTSLVQAIERCKECHQETCLVTFDQPLYWKARDIISAPNAQFHFDHVVIRLGGFHLLMSFMGAIGSIMKGSGIEQLLCTIYAENSVLKIMSGHAYSRAVRAHILTHLALTKIIMENIDYTDDERDELDNLLIGFNRRSVYTAGENTEVKNAVQKFQQALTAIENRGPTAKLWVQYHRMASLVKRFIEAERSGNWALHLDTVQRMLPFFHASGHFLYAKSAHLYLQDMLLLKDKMPAEEYEKFTSGSFTIRRTHKFWSGIMSDQTIEQALMKIFKVELARRAGVKESKVAAWTLGMVHLQNICEEMEHFAGVCCATTEQHVDMRLTRVKRDNEDVEKLDIWLGQHNPFPLTKELVSLGTGIVGSSDINCHLAEEVGRDMMTNIINKTFDSISSKRKDKVQPLAAMSCSIKVDATRVTINPLLLFQRMCVLKYTDADMKKYMTFELAPFPLSLFTMEGMRKSTKSTLYSEFEPMSTCVQTGLTKVFVIDGGFLLHKVVWIRVSTFGEICKKYVAYVQQHFDSDVTVVFDGYPDDISIGGTKTCERMRRERMHQTIEVMFQEDTVMQTSQEKFLANSKNKQRLITMVCSYFAIAGISFCTAFEDADTVIVQTAIEKSSVYDHVEIVGEDVDLLVLLTGLAHDKHNIFFRKPAKGKIPVSLYSPASLKNPEVACNILLLHAISGCDTTSAFFNIGKKTFTSLLRKNPQLTTAAELFKVKNIDTQLLVSAGERILIAVYGGDAQEPSLDSLRFKRFTQSVTKSTFNLAKLPPTKTAAREHILRTYHQVQMWMGNLKDPEDYGWKRTHQGLEPITNNAQPAPAELLQMIACKCKSKCTRACSCRKAGLQCSVLCKNCEAQNCDNLPSVLDDDTDDDESDDEEISNVLYVREDDGETEEEEDNQPLAKISRMSNI